MTEQTTTIGQELLSIIENIDENLFCKDSFENEQGQRCVVGHYNKVKYNNPHQFSEHHKIDDPIRKITAKFFAEKYNVVSINGIAWINNFDTFPPYTEVKIKDRVVHVIKDMVAAGY